MVAKDRDALVLGRTNIVHIFNEGKKANSATVAQ